MNKKTIAWIGWLPALIIPIATLLQFIEVFRAPSVDGVSWLTWVLFAVANIAFYVFTEKYTSPQAILGFLGTAAIDIAIVITVIVRT